MSLSWKGFTPEQFIAELTGSAARTRRESKKVMRQGAKEILAVSKENAPIDEGDLEAAHELSIVRLNKDDMMIEITVGGTVNGTDVDSYAWLMHERLAPYGDLNLGPKSIEKNNSNPTGHFVGGKFLDRAIDELEPEIIERIKNTLPGD